MTSVDFNFNFLCGRPHGAWPPFPVHMRPPEPDSLPLHVDVINGWPLMGEHLLQGHYAVAWGRFEPAAFRLQGTEHTPKPPRPIMHKQALFKIGTMLTFVSELKLSITSFSFASSVDFSPWSFSSFFFSSADSFSCLAGINLSSSN